MNHPKKRRAYRPGFDSMEPRTLLTTGPAFLPAAAIDSPEVQQPTPQLANRPLLQAIASMDATTPQLANRPLLQAIASMDVTERQQLDVPALRASLGTAAWNTQPAPVAAVAAAALSRDQNPFSNLPFLEPVTDLRVGDILVSTEDATSSGFIRSVTFSAYSHAALYVGDGMIIDATKDGVQRRELSALTQPAIRVGVIRVTDLTASQQEIVKGTASRLIGKPYNTFGLIFGGIVELHPIYRYYRLVTGNPLKMTPSTLGPGYFCSELVIKAFQTARVKIASESGDTPGGIISYAQANPNQFQFVGRLATGS